MQQKSKEEKKKHAIEFVHFVLSNPLYADMFNRNTKYIIIQLLTNTHNSYVRDFIYYET